MSVFKYIIRSLWFFRKQHLAVFAGTIISTAVLTGALVVGDSVRLSLKSLVDVRLGKATHALQTGDRFVSAQLEDALSDELDFPVASLLLMNGIAVDPGSGIRVPAVQVAGYDRSFSLFFERRIPALAPGEAHISQNLADKLELQAGDDFLLRVEDLSVIPLNAPFARQTKPSVGIRLSVGSVLPDDGAGRFSLSNNQAAPLNVLVDRTYLAEQLALGNRVNTLLVATSPGAETSPDILTSAFRKVWKAADMGIQLYELPRASKTELQSDRIFIDTAVATVVFEAFPSVEPVLTYLVNAIRSGENSIPYSFVTASNEPYFLENREGLITINDWVADDLVVSVGDTLVLEYFVVGPLQQLEEQSHDFVVGRIIPAGAYPVDSTLMPNYPGLSDADNCRDWDTGIPIDLKLIRDKDEFYWDDFKGTPKGLIAYSQGEKLWENDFGKLTAIRMGNDLVTPESLEALLVEKVDPADLNLFFRPVYQQGLNAADNGVDFGELFLSLSFFVILAAVLLTVLLFSLQTESRMKEAGLLAALGFGRKKIISLRVLESLAIAFFGSLLGSFLGILYNHGLVLGLNSVWQDAVHTDILRVYVEPATMLTGMTAGMIIGLLSIFLVSRRKLSGTVVALLHGLQSESAQARNKRPLLALITGFGGLFLSLLILVYSLYLPGELNAGLFLAAGGLFLLGLLGGLATYLSRVSKGVKNEVPGRLQLALVNASRKRSRSMTTIALFALGTFTVVITGANRKSFYGAENDRSSGTGGFAYWAETTMPLPYDVQTEAGRTQLGTEDNALITDTSVVQFMALDGDDASCLNLNQVQQPRILGVDPDELQQRSAFSFAQLQKGILHEHAWDELKKTYENGVIPAYADQTVITWGLKKKIGDTLHYRNEAGEPLRLVLAGGFENSVFQGNLLIDIQHFRENFPSVSGSSLLLIDEPPGDDTQARTELEAILADYGISITPTGEKLASFNSVENTYLSVFMVLGGLGVLIGTIGLGIIMLRNIQERKKELALLNALGFTRVELVLNLVLENGLLLLAGMFSGTFAACIGILPSLLSPAYTIPGSFMVWLLLSVLFSGMLWIWMPARQIVNLPLITALRNE